MSAAFLLRFDDICPTMNWDVWRQIEEIMISSDLQPIIAVVPDNQDPVLQVMPANAAFWDQVRRWQGLGWTIALHGYQHRAVTSDPGIIGLNARSEFAGVPYDEQLAGLTEAVNIFRREGIEPHVWVAPGHSFDQNTLIALRSLGICCVSDGMFPHPHADETGMFWVPQQLWRFYPMPAGVWTVCLHHNNWSPSDLKAFSESVARYRNRITSFHDVVDRYTRRRRSAADTVVSRLLLGGIWVKRFARSVLQRGAR